MKTTEEKLLSLWRDPKFGGSYRGVKTFQMFLKTDKNIDVSEKELYNIVKKDPIYLMHLQTKSVKRRKYFLSNVGELIQSDLAFMFPFNGYKYFIVFIDCYSFNLYTEAIKDKKSVTVLETFKRFLKKSRIIDKLETDQGTEYSLCKKFCNQNKIIFHYKRGENKANFAEYAILQIKKRLYKILRGNLTKDWPTYLKIVQSDFNKTPLKKLGYFSPNNIVSRFDSYFINKAKIDLNINETSLPTFEEQNTNEKNYFHNPSNLKVKDFVYVNLKADVFSKSFDVQVHLFKNLELSASQTLFSSACL